jgi:hypothetical protein
VWSYGFNVWRWLGLSLALVRRWDVRGSRHSFCCCGGYPLLSFGLLSANSGFGLRFSRDGLG